MRELRREIAREDLSEDREDLSEDREDLTEECKIERESRFVLVVRPICW